MTNESKSLTEKWIADKGVTYAYAYDGGKKFLRALGLKGWPTAWLVDPSGRIVWRGHPGSLKAETIEKHLAGALQEPIYAWPKQGDKAKKALLKGDWAKAIEAARAEGDWGAKVAASLEGMVAGRVQEVQELREIGDYMRAVELAERYGDELKKLPAADTLEAVIEAIENDDRAQDILKTQLKIVKVMSGKLSKRKLEAAMDQMREIEKEYAGTHAAVDAKAAWTRLHEIRAGG